MSMWPSKFDYHRASSVEEAIKLITENEGASLLAGGHSMVPAMKLRLTAPEALVDLGSIDELKHISFADGTLTIGAMANHTQTANSADVQTHAPALAAACSGIGDAQVRNWGTMGGNVAHADPAADLPTVVMAYGGTIHVQGPGGSREIAAEDFFLEIFTTALEHGEIITKVTIPSASGKKAAYTKLQHPASRYAMVGVCVILDMDGGTCSSARVVAGGATATPVRSAGAEAALAGSDCGDDALAKAAAALQADLGEDLMGDIHASSDYRRAMAGVYLKRAVKAALA